MVREKDLFGVCIASALSGTTFVDKSPVANSSYYYWVKSYKGSTASSFSSPAWCADTDRYTAVTKSIALDALLNVVHLTADLVDDINAILAWDPAWKPSVSGRLDSFSGTATESLLVTQAGIMVSGSASVNISESGHVTGQYTAGIPHVASVGFGAMVNKSCSINVAETYSISTGWVVNPSASRIQGAISASGFGTGAVGAYSGQISLNVPSTNFTGTGSGQMTINPHISVAVTYQVTAHSCISATPSIEAPR